MPVRRVRRRTHPSLKTRCCSPASRQLTRLPEAHRGRGPILLGSQRDLHWCGRPDSPRAGSREAGALTVIDWHQRNRRCPWTSIDRRLLLLTAEGLRCRWRVWWIAIPLPETIDRAVCVEIKRSSGRRTSLECRRSSSLTTALNNSRKDRTHRYARRGHTLIMMENQIRWLTAAAASPQGHPRVAPSRIHPQNCSWAERSEYAAPFVVDADARSERRWSP